MNRKTLIETAKFVVRMLLLVAMPQLLALAADNSGVLWADLLSVMLPVVDKAVHESDSKLKGLVPF